MLRCLLVDDEPLALRLLTSYVERVPFLELVGTCRSALEAMTVLQQESVDVLFLDIQMPDLTGVEFVRTLRPEALVIFTTAYEAYALEGFNLNAVDYLVKPFAFDRFVQAAQKAQDRLQARRPTEPVAAPPAPAPADDFIFVKADYHTQRINLRDIRYLEGLKDYIKIYTGAGKPVLTLNSLKAFEDRLPSQDFVRVHRSFIIALSWIDSIRKNRIYLGEAIIPIGDSYADAFHKLIEERNMH
ncbi:response regulator transcription factor [Hymenobacter taeanensis]|uniref:Response regulator transcription factor n=1 Tax=Hymenobacter taeanensis TaxID=2735321 RepID=A0A6M6BM09_9BACT|nr:MULTISPECIES: LytTR family DNA-binding domain-containing protein [Hymenobacter]QJX49029.1 response regulator transcription factor [Hymenobacter taeanensis]UOQ81454.1 LytTR family DNA-binding domain-containing protein [Hymenobacter sp. 5414T-23]